MAPSYVALAELEMNIFWIRQNPEIFQEHVRKFISEHRGLKIHVEQFLEHWIIVVAEKK